MLVEALGAGFYADAHLPGAINIPPGHVDALAPALLPDRDAAVVVYCTGPCSEQRRRRASARGARLHDVAVYEGGKEDWVEHGLPLERSTRPRTEPATARAVHSGRVQQPRMDSRTATDQRTRRRR